MQKGKGIYIQNMFVLYKVIVYNYASYVIALQEVFYFWKLRYLQEYMLAVFSLTKKNQLLHYLAVLL